MMLAIGEEGGSSSAAKCMDHIVEDVCALWKSNEKAVLASIVRVQGSAYRREGAKMLFLAGGGLKGTLSAGCMESDLAYRAESALADSSTSIQVYDMSSDDDFTWGRGSGCNGVISVLLEPIPGLPDSAATDYWSTVLGFYAAGRTVHTLRRLNAVNGETTGFLIDASDGNVLGSLGDAAVDAQWLKTLSDFATESRSFTSLVDGDELFVLERLVPKERLFIFGAGPDAEPMVDILGQLGFDITLVDHRPVRLDAALFPRARYLVDSHAEEAAEKVDIPDASYAIVMTHSFQSDRAWIQYLITKKLRYLGVLGPKLRTVRLLQTDALPAFVKSPIGLDLGTDGPEEIAVSVAAQLIQVRREIRAR